MEHQTKNILRKNILSLLKNQKEEDRLRKSRIIQDKLLATPAFQRAQVILFYASFNGEVDTFSMMRQAQNLGKKIALPTIMKDQKKIIPSYVEDLETELMSGPYGIQQPKENSLRPVDCKDIHLAIVPGVAFDRRNNRLGRGGGYYDRFLSSLPEGIPTFGLAFDFQILDDLPHLEAHDISVSDVLVN